MRVFVAGATGAIGKQMVVADAPDPDRVAERALGWAPKHPSCRRGFAAA
jgi:uncharacterized protein YbjT (DUF2867 family)